MLIWGLSAQLENDIQGKGLPADDFRLLNSEEKVRSLSVALTNFCIKDIRTVSTELCKLNQTIGTFIWQFKTIEWESNRLSRPLFFRRLAKLLQSHNLTGGIFNASIARVS